MTREEKIAGLVDYGRFSEEHYAIKLLEFFNWDYDKAIDYYWRNFILTCDCDVDT